MLAALPMSMLSALVAAVIFLLAVAPTAAQQTPGCGETRVFLEQGGPVLFELPRQAGERVQLDPNKAFTLRVSGAPASGAVQMKLILAPGVEIKQDYPFQLPAPGAEARIVVEPERLGVAAALGLGVYGVELSMTSAGQVCKAVFEAEIGELIATPEATATATAVVRLVIATARGAADFSNGPATAVIEADPTPDPSPADPLGCGETRLFLEQGGLVIFEGPRQEGERLQLDPDHPFTLRVSGALTSGTAQLKKILPFGAESQRDYEIRLSTPGADGQAEVQAEDLVLAGVLSGGVYKVELGFISPEQICRTSFDARVGTGIISTPVAAATAGAAAVGAAGTVASAGLSASGAHANLKLKVSLARRRRTGWKRWVPFPNWKRTAIGSVIGSIFGVLLALFFQQGGIEALTTFSLVRTAFLGAFSSFGLGMAWATVLNYVKPAIPEGEKEPPPPLGLATLIKVLEKIGIRLPQPWKRKKP
jgi:hypothetical protein